TEEPRSDCTGVTLELQLRSEVMGQVLKLTQLVHNWDYILPQSYAFNQLKKLLLTGADLKGIYKEAPFPANENIHVWMELQFRTHWLDLYKLARKVRKRKLQSEWTFILAQFAFRT